MSSNYFYKGISVSQICSNNGNTNVSGYTGMPITSYTNYSGLRPLTFGYTSGSTDICNQYTAPNTGIITATGSTTGVGVAIPSGANSCRIISVGGGGGSGGSGGDASSESYNGDASSAQGGFGGTGGYGSYVYANVGGAGSQSWVYLTGGTLFTANYQSINAATANGGSGGSGGGAATANASENKATSSGGSKGASGMPTTQQANDGNFPILSNYGNPGTQGVVQIIWLYD